MEFADLDTLAAILTACPTATHVPGIGPLLLAIFMLAAGHTEQATTAAAEMAVESCTDIQKRANRIRLNKLLAAGDSNLPPEFKTTLNQIAELFTPTTKTPSE